jgi:hypothetical protein
MINFLIAVALILFVIILITYLVRLMNEPTYFDDDVEETITTTTTTTTTVVEEPTVAAVVTVDQLPSLERKFKENGQPFCIDPADNTEWMLNTNDDMYEDASGKWWKLV